MTTAERPAMASNEAEEAFLREAYRSARGRHAANSFRRSAFMPVLIVAAFAVLVLVIVSPLALRQLGSIHGLNWVQLSNIGQTYGAASALLTGLALIGVAGSMVFQVRAIEVNRQESMRGQHAHLIEIALADPVYMRAWGFDPKVYGGSDRLRQLLYINLILSFWADRYRLGDIQETSMRGDLAILFRGEAGRNFWAVGRYARLQISRSQPDARFHRIVDEEYQKAITTGSFSVQAEESPSTSPVNQRPLLRNPAIKNGAVLLVGAMGGIAIKTLLRQRRR